MYERGRKVVIGPVSQLVVEPQPRSSVHHAAANLEFGANELLVMVTGVGAHDRRLSNTKPLGERSRCCPGAVTVPAHVHVPEFVDLIRRDRSGVGD